MNSYIHKLKYIYMGESERIPKELKKYMIPHNIAQTYHISPVDALDIPMDRVIFMNVANTAKAQAKF